MVGGTIFEVVEGGTTSLSVWSRWQVVRFSFVVSSASSPCFFSPLGRPSYISNVLAQFEDFLDPMLTSRSGDIARCRFNAMPPSFGVRVEDKL